MDEAAALDPDVLAPGQDHVHCQPVQPCPYCRLTAECRRFLPGSDEDILRDVIGFVRVEHTAHQRMDPGNVAPVQALERTGIPACRECRIGRYRVSSQSVLEHLSGHARSWIFKRAKRL